jgi:type IV secretory pathway TrbF-like protein
MRKRSRRGDGCAPEYVLQRDESVWNPQSGSAAAKARRRRLPVIGLWLVSASLVSGLIWQVIWIVDVNRFVQSEDITSEDIDDLPGRPRGTVHLARVLVDVSGLGIPVQRRRCRDCRQLHCRCVVWRVGICSAAEKISEEFQYAMRDLNNRVGK